MKAAEYGRCNENIAVLDENEVQMDAMVSVLDSLIALSKRMGNRTRPTLSHVPSAIHNIQGQADALRRHADPEVKAFGKTLHDEWRAWFGPEWLAFDHIVAASVLDPCTVTRNLTPVVSFNEAMDIIEASPLVTDEERMEPLEVVEAGANPFAAAAAGAGALLSPFRKEVPIFRCHQHSQAVRVGLGGMVAHTGQGQRRHDSGPAHHSGMGGAVHPCHSRLLH